MDCWEWNVRRKCRIYFCAEWFGLFIRKICGKIRTKGERSDREDACIFEAAPVAGKKVWYKRTTGKRKAGLLMANQNFIFSMQPYNIEKLSSQTAWMLEQITQQNSRKKLPALWKLTDKLNAAERASEAALKRRKARRKLWGGLFLVMGVFLFVPGIMQPQELIGPLLAGLFAILIGMLYLRRDEKKKDVFENKAAALLEKMNASMQQQKLRMIISDNGITLSGIEAEEKKISYEKMEYTFETKDLFAMVYENQIILLQKEELMLGKPEELRKRFAEKTVYFSSITVSK